MPPPTKVWMVVLGRRPVVEVEGELRFEDDGLLFEPRNEAPATRLRFETIVKAARLRGSPVLMITHGASGAREQTAFYFTQPPALTHIVKARTPSPAAETDLRSIRPAPFGLGQRKPSKRRSVRTNATYLAQEGTNRKRELQAWVEEIRTQQRRA